MAPSPNLQAQASLALDVSFERTRAMHRVWRALNDGDCPKCHTFHSAVQMVRGEGDVTCPTCGFTIHADEIAALQQEFAPAMDKAVAIFEEWSKAFAWRKVAKAWVSIKGLLLSYGIYDDGSGARAGINLRAFYGPLSPADRTSLDEAWRDFYENTLAVGEKVRWKDDQCQFFTRTVRQARNLLHAFDKSGPPETVAEMRGIVQSLDVLFGKLAGGASERAQDSPVDGADMTPVGIKEGDYITLPLALVSADFEFKLPDLKTLPPSPNAALPEMDAELSHWADVLWRALQNEYGPKSWSRLRASSTTEMQWRQFAARIRDHVLGVRQVVATPDVKQSKE